MIKINNLSHGLLRRFRDFGVALLVWTGRTDAHERRLECCQEAGLDLRIALFGKCLHRHMVAKRTDDAKSADERMRTLIHSRSPSHLRRLERERGLDQSSSDRGNSSPQQGPIHA